MKLQNHRMASLPHSLQCVDCTTQLGVVVKLAEGTLNPIVLVDKDVKITQYSCQHSKQYGLKKRFHSFQHSVSYMSEYDLNIGTAIQ